MPESCDVFHTKEGNKAGFLCANLNKELRKMKTAFVIGQFPNAKEKYFHSNKSSVIGYQKSTDTGTP